MRTGEIQLIVRNNHVNIRKGVHVSYTNSWDQDHTAHPRS